MVSYAGEGPAFARSPLTTLFPGSRTIAELNSKTLTSLPIAYVPLNVIQISIELRDAAEDAARGYRLDDIEHFSHGGLRMNDVHLAAVRLDRLARADEAT